ncbi:hypothetical protein D3C81_881410 [compost metagenome]
MLMSVTANEFLHEGLSFPILKQIRAAVIFVLVWESLGEIIHARSGRGTDFPGDVLLFFRLVQYRE